MSRFVSLEGWFRSFFMGFFIYFFEFFPLTLVTWKLSFVVLLNFIFTKLSRSYNQVADSASWFECTQVCFFFLFLIWFFLIFSFNIWLLHNFFFCGLSRSHLIVFCYQIRSWRSFKNINRIYFHNTGKHLFFKLIIVNFFIWFDLFNIIFFFINNIIKLIEFETNQVN